MTGRFADRVASRVRAARTLAVLVAVALTLAACSGFTEKISRRFGGKVSFDVSLDPRLNQDFPLAVDFVVVYDKDLYKELQKKQASEWFKEREQLRQDNEPEHLEVRSWEWVPSPHCPQCPAPETQVINYRLGAQGGVVFANYFNSTGPHRRVVEPLDPFTLVLGETGMTLGPAKSKKDAKADKKKAKKAKKADKKKKKAGL